MLVRAVGVDSVVGGQKIVPVGITLRRYMLGGVRVHKSVKHFLPLYDAGNKGLTPQQPASSTGGYSHTPGAKHANRNFLHLQQPFCSLAK